MKFKYYRWITKKLQQWQWVKTVVSNSPEVSQYFAVFYPVTMGRGKVKSTVLTCVRKVCKHSLGVRGVYVAEFW